MTTQYRSQASFIIAGQPAITNICQDCPLSIIIEKLTPSTTLANTPFFLGIRIHQPAFYACCWYIQPYCEAHRWLLASQPSYIGVLSNLLGQNSSANLLGLARSQHCPAALSGWNPIHPEWNHFSSLLLNVLWGGSSTHLIRGYSKPVAWILINQ